METGIIWPTKNEKLVLLGLYGGSALGYTLIKSFHMQWDFLSTSAAAMGLGLFFGLALKWHRVYREWPQKQTQNARATSNEKLIDDIKTIVFTTTNATGEGDLDSTLRLYFEKKSVVENTTETPR